MAACSVRQMPQGLCDLKQDASETNVTDLLANWLLNKEYDGR